MHRRSRQASGRKLASGVGFADLAVGDRVRCTDGQHGRVETLSDTVAIVLLVRRPRSRRVVRRNELTYAPSKADLVAAREALKASWDRSERRRRAGRPEQPLVLTFGGFVGGRESE